MKELKGLDTILEPETIAKLAKDYPNETKLLIAWIAVNGTVALAKIIMESGYEIDLEIGGLKIHLGKPVIQNAYT